jgi:hypothetical protein
VIVRDIVSAVEGAVEVEGDLAQEVTGCYVSDLLSDVLANSAHGDLWVTHHTHPNVVAVAAVKGLAGVVMVGGKPLDPEAIERARVEKVNVIVSPLSAFEAAGSLFGVLKGARKES